MANPYPANFETLQGGGRLTGQVNFTDAGNQPGGAVVTARGIFTGGGTSDPTIADNDIDVLGWGATSITNNVLDLTNKFQPTVLAAGVHAVSVSIAPYDLTADGFFQMVLTLAGLTDSLHLTDDSRLATGRIPQASIAGCWYFAQGDNLDISIRNRDGAASRRFGIDVASVQRIT